jgi:hypothetical protein
MARSVGCDVGFSCGGWPELCKTGVDNCDVILE